MTAEPAAGVPSASRLSLRPPAFAIVFALLLLPIIFAFLLLRGVIDVLTYVSVVGGSFSGAAVVFVVVQTLFSENLEERRRRETKLSGCTEFTRQHSPSYYRTPPDELIPVPSEGTSILQSIFKSTLDLGGPLPLDSVKFNPQDSQPYVLPPELEELSEVIRASYEAKRARFKATDKIGVVTCIDVSNSLVNVSYCKATMLDEYTTIQNPEMDYWTLAVNPSREDCEHTVRTFFSERGPPGTVPSLPPLANGRIDPPGRWPAYRAAAHVILLLKDAGTGWPNREFVLQRRPPVGVATGAGEWTSTTGAGIDYADLRWYRVPLRGHAPWREPFEEFVHREMRYEMFIDRDDVIRLGLVAITRDIQRVGQPVFIILGETNLTYWQLLELKRTSYRPWPIFSNWWRGRGKEKWESSSLMLRRISDIPKLLADPKVQSSTKAALYFLREGGDAGFAKVPEC